MTSLTRTPAFLIVGALVTLLVGCGAPSGNLGTVPPPAQTPAASGGPVVPDLTPGPDVTPGTSGSPSGPASSAPSSQPSSPAATTIVRAYFVLGGAPGSTGLVPVLRVLPHTAAVATAAINALLAGPTATESGLRTITSAVPTGSRLLGLSIKNGVATVDLSTEFDSGGGSASMRYRLPVGTAEVIVRRPDSSAVGPANRAFIAAVATAAVCGTARRSGTRPVLPGVPPRTK